MISLRSRPLSLAIWSISRLRFSMRQPSFSARLREVRARETIDRVGPRHLLEGDPELCPVDAHARDAVLEGDERAAEAAPPVLRPPRLERDLRPAGRREVLPAVEPRRGDLEPERDGDGVGGVEVRRDLARDGGARLDRHAPVARGRVDRDAQVPRRAAARQHDIDELEARRLDDRLDQVAKLLRDVPIHGPWTHIKNALDPTPRGSGQRAGAGVSPERGDRIESVAATQTWRYAGRAFPGRRRPY